MDQELSEIVDAGRFKRSPIHVFDSNFTLSDLENLTIFQCPFVGGFVHLTEQNFNFLRNDSRFDKVVGGNQTGVVRFVIYKSDSTGKEGKRQVLDYSQVEECILNLEHSYNLEKMVNGNFWQQLDLPLENRLIQAQNSSKIDSEVGFGSQNFGTELSLKQAQNSSNIDSETGFEHETSLQGMESTLQGVEDFADEKQFLLYNRARRVQNLRRDNRGNGDLLVEGDYLFWRQFFWNKVTNTKSLKTGKAQTVPSSQLQQFSGSLGKSLDDMTEAELMHMLDSDTEAFTNESSQKSGEQADLRSEIENLYFGLDLLEDETWNVMPQTLIVSLRNSNIGAKKGIELSPAFAKLDTLLVSIR